MVGTTLLAMIPCGCGAILREAVKDVTPEVITDAVKELANPETQQQVIAAVDESRVKALTARLSAGFVDGVLDSLEEPARRARLEAIVNGIASKAAGSATDTVLARVLDEGVEARMRLAMRGTLLDLLKAGGSEEQTKAFGVAAHEIARQATLGFQDALDDTRRDRASGKMPKVDGAIVIAANNASQTGGRILWTLGIGLGALALGLAMTLVWAIRKNRLRRSEVQQRDNALILLTDALKSTAAQPGSQELRDVLKASMRDRAGAEHIRKVLGEEGRHMLGIDIDRPP
jgi:hypothetical protein